MTQQKYDGFVNTTGVEAIPVAGAVDVYSNSIKIDRSDDLSIYLKATGAGVVNVLVKLEVGMARPNTEGSSDTAWSTPDGYADIKNLVNTDLFQKKLADIGFPFVRLKLEGQGANGADVTVTGRLFKQQKTL